ncbi:MAG: histidine kinase [Oscillospiraceae bacterium]
MMCTNTGFRKMTMQRIRAFFLQKRFPIRNTIFAVIIFVICVPLILLTFFSMKISEATIVESVKNDSLANISSTDYSFGLIVEAIENSLSEKASDTMKLIPFLTFDTQDTRQTFSAYERKIISECQYVNRVSIVSKKTGQILSNDPHLKSRGTFFTPSFINTLERIADGTLKTETLKNTYQLIHYNRDLQLFVTKPHFVTDKIGTSLGINISFIKAIINPVTNELGGFLIYSINPQVFAEIFKPVAEIKNCDFLILDYSFQILSSLDPKNIATSFYSLSGVSQIYFENNNNGIFDYNGKPTIFTTKKASNLDLTFIILTPYTYVEYFLNYNKEKFWVIIVAGIAFSIIASTILSRSISKPVVTLKKKMESFSSGNLFVKNTKLGNNEFSDLTNSFNDMTDKISRLIHSLDHEEAIVENYKFRLTQAQINPHFLYNVLEMISSLINIGMYEEAQSATTKLSLFYRTSLSDGVDVISVEKEYSNLRNYLDLQKMRYIEYFDFAIDISPDVLKCSIPKLTIQPLAENAISHGTRQSKRNGFLEISIFLKNDRLCIVIRDNGVGMSQSKIKELVAEANSDIIVKHFGISSVIHRLNYYFDNDVEFNIESKENEYTRFFLCIPNKPYDKKQE